MTEETLMKLFSLYRENMGYSAYVTEAMNKYQINTANRARAFLAQLGHECQHLRTLSENLNYSKKGLLAVFPKYFNSASASDYERKPEKIANRVYANRGGNGNEASGDGWRYRGRGGFQITFKDNYKKISLKMKVQHDFVANPDLLSTPEFAFESAAWWWQDAGLNEIADKLNEDDDIAIFTQITRKINGGTNGINDRWNLYLLAKKYIS